MAEALLQTHGLNKRFGGVVATDDLSLDIAEGELQALIGPNGAGKTTLVAQLAGELAPDSGRVTFAGEDISMLSASQRVRRGLARTFQVAQLLDDYSALDNVALAVQARAGHSFRFWADAREDGGLREVARDHLVRVGLGGRGDVPVSALSHGEQKQLELAIALASAPRLLLLDEPMAGLGAAESATMIALLRSLKGQITILLVEHDMDAVFALADRVSVLVYGRCIARGSGAQVRANPAVRSAYLGEGDA